MMNPAIEKYLQEKNTKSVLLVGIEVIESINQSISPSFLK